MRKLGQKLGVEAMSLYNHVANKDDILDGMVDVVFSEIDLPSAGSRLEGGHAPAGDLDPRNADSPSLGGRIDGIADHSRSRDPATP